MGKRERHTQRESEKIESTRHSPLQKYIKMNMAHIKYSIVFVFFIFVPCHSKMIGDSFASNNEYLIYLKIHGISLSISDDKLVFDDSSCFQRINMMYYNLAYMTWILCWIVGVPMLFFFFIFPNSIYICQLTCGRSYSFL